MLKHTKCSVIQSELRYQSEGSVAAMKFAVQVIQLTPELWVKIFRKSPQVNLDFSSILLAVSRPFRAQSRPYSTSRSMPTGAVGAMTQGVLPYISYIGMCSPKLFWSENGYRFCTLWSEIGYGFQGNFEPRG